MLLDVDAGEGARRQQVEGKRPDRLERAGAEFHRRVCVGYRELAVQVPGLLVVPAGGSVAEVQQRVLHGLAQRHPETFIL